MILLQQMSKKKWLIHRESWIKNTMEFIWPELGLVNLHRLAFEEVEHYLTKNSWIRLKYHFFNHFANLLEFELSRWTSL